MPNPDTGGYNPENKGNQEEQLDVNIKNFVDHTGEYLEANDEVNIEDISGSLDLENLTVTDDGEVQVVGDSENIDEQIKALKEAKKGGDNIHRLPDGTLRIERTNSEDEKVSLPDTDEEWDKI
jgi:hypothetical protein